MLAEDLAPAELLGLPVLDAAGARLGVVLDVGLWSSHRAKFVLVGEESGRDVRRVELRGMALERGEALRVAALPA